MLDILHLIFNYFYDIIIFIASFEVVSGLSVLNIAIILSLLYFVFKLIRR